MGRVDDVHVGRDGGLDPRVAQGLDGGVALVRQTGHPQTGDCRADLGEGLPGQGADRCDLGLGAVGVTVDFVPNGHHRLALGIGALLAGLLVLWGALEVWLRRRSGAVTTADGEAAVVHATVRDVDADVDSELGDVAADAEAGVAPFVLGVLLGALLGLLVAGWWGLLAGAVGAVLTRRRVSAASAGPSAEPSGPRRAG